MWPGLHQTNASTLNLTEWCKEEEQSEIFMSPAASAMAANPRAQWPSGICTQVGQRQQPQQWPSNRLFPWHIWLILSSPVFQGPACFPSLVLQFSVISVHWKQSYWWGLGTLENLVSTTSLRTQYWAREMACMVRRLLCTRKLSEEGIILREVGESFSLTRKRGISIGRERARINYVMLACNRGYQCESMVLIKIDR